MTHAITKYNPGIDGLRSIAVLSVFAYHLNNSWLPGGFLGVDIFFTISGYLITLILINAKLKNNFSYADFYKRRIKRILPAYFFMLFITVVLASIIVLPYDYYKFSVSGLTSLFFLSNIDFSLRHGDYFSNDAAQWPLLHTWSLSVEEQFYFVWPAVIGLAFYWWAQKEKPLRRLKLLILGIVVASLVIATLLSGDRDLAKWGYYSVVTRASELLIGAWLACHVYEKENNDGFSKHSVLIAALVLLSCFIFYKESMPFPSYWVLPPCLATLVILGGEKSGIVYRLLSSRLMVGIGLISYSLYLWHWPIISLTKYVHDLGSITAPFNIGPGQAISIVCLAFMLALISYKFVESPIRRNNWNFRKSFVLLFLIPTVGSSLFFLGAIKTKGYAQRVASEGLNPMEAFFSVDKEKCPLPLSLGCVGGDTLTPGRKRFLLLGNSHAEHYFELLSLLAKEAKVQVDLAGGGGCDITRQTLKCQSIYNYALENQEKYDGYIIADRWTSASFAEDSKKKSAYDDYLPKLIAFNKPISFLGRLPEYDSDIDKYANYIRLFNKPPMQTARPLQGLNVQEVNASVSEYLKQYDINFVDVYSLLGNADFEFGVVSKDGVPLYVDSHHFSVFGSKMMAEALIRNSTPEEIVQKYFGS